jgi:hypothetical protein
VKINKSTNNFFINVSSPEYGEIEISPPHETHRALI